MSSTGLILLASFAVAGLVGVVFLLYRNELGRARGAACRGSLVANTAAGPIEYAEKVPALRCYPFTAPAVVLIRSSPTRQNLSMTDFASSHLPVSDICAHLFRQIPPQRRKLMRMPRFSPS
jgi:hypothetical protein